jgi:hypothetical protein
MAAARAMAATAAVIMAETDLRLLARAAEVGDRHERTMRRALGTSRAGSSRPRGRGGSDRLSVLLFSLAAFLAVFALLVSQLPAAGSAVSQPVPVLRKIIITRIIETIKGGSGPNGTSVSQSVSGSSSGPSAVAPTTHTS